MAVRENLAVDPAATRTVPLAGAGGGQWLARWFGGGAWAGTITAVIGATDSPLPGLGTYLRKTWTAAVEGATANDVGWGWSAAAYRLPVTPGTTYTASRWLRASIDAAGAWRNRLVVTPRDDAETAVGATVSTADTAFAAGEWVRQWVTFTAPEGATWVTAGDSVYLGTNSAAGMTLDETGLLIEEADTARDWFDGDTPDTAITTYAWAGEPHASTSTATGTSVEASVLLRAVPVAQIVINNLPPGATWRVVGVAGGHTWPVPSGQGTDATGEQIVLIDPRIPFNQPVTYRLTVTGIPTIDSDQVEASLPGVDVVLGTLGGEWTVIPESLGAGDFPRGIEAVTVQYQIPGRRRGPVRWAAPAQAPTTWALHCSAALSDELEHLLSLGVPLVYRLGDTVRDLPPVDFFVVLEASSVSYPDDGAWRTWTLQLTFIDDPEPSTGAVASTWDDHDAVYAATTWDQWDAEWLPETWDTWDRVDWRARL